ncbi:MAG: hypothetical protein AB7S26_34415 [Sandaracinaceae bacterium]
MQGGYLTLGRIKGIPIRAHWTVPIGMLMFSGGRLEPALWLGVLLVIVLHELGHAFIVNRVGLVNAGIDLTGFGGMCRWMGQPTRVQRAMVAWGGVWAQLVLLAIALPIRLVLGWTGIPIVDGLLRCFTEINGIMILFNLIPFGPLDGREAWPLFRYLWEDRRRRQKYRRAAKGDPLDSPGAQTLREALRDAERNKDRPS